MNLANIVDVNVIAWEERARFNIWEGLYKTWIFIILKPIEFFAKVSSYKDKKHPLVFGMSILGISLFWYLVISLASGIHTTIRKGEFFSGTFFVILFFPLFYLLFSYLFSGILHGIIYFLQGRKNFNHTFRIVNYSWAAGIFSILPFMGTFISSVWYFALMIIGIKHLHRLDWPRAVISAAAACLLFMSAIFMFRLVFIR